MDNSIMKYVSSAKVEAIQDAYRDEKGYWLILKDGWEASRTKAGCKRICADNIRDLKFQVGGIQPIQRTAKKTSEAQRKAIAEWVKGRDTIVLRISKKDGAAIREAAKEAGKSITKYILDRAIGEERNGDQ